MFGFVDRKDQFNRLIRTRGARLQFQIEPILDGVNHSSDQFHPAPAAASGESCADIRVHRADIVERSAFQPDPERYSAEQIEESKKAFHIPNLRFVGQRNQMEGTILFRLPAEHSSTLAHNDETEKTLQQVP